MKNPNDNNDIPVYMVEFYVSYLQNYFWLLKLNCIAGHTYLSDKIEQKSYLAHKTFMGSLHDIGLDLTIVWLNKKS